MTLAYAVHRLNGIATPANAAYSASELEFQLKSSGAKALFTVSNISEMQITKLLMFATVHTPPRNLPASCQSCRHSQGASLYPGAAKGAVRRQASSLQDCVTID